MHIEHAEVRSIVSEYLWEDDRVHLDLIVQLTWIAALTVEFGFQCRPEAREVKKQEFLALLADQFKDVDDLMRKAATYEISITFDSEDQPVTSEDLVAIRGLLHLFSAREGGPSREALATWIDEAWEYGVHQHRVYTCEAEGGIMNTLGIAREFAAKLAMYGTRKGLLPPT